MAIMHLQTILPGLCPGGLLTRCGNAENKTTGTIATGSVAVEELCEIEKLERRRQKQKGF